MTIGPLTPDETKIREAFRSLRIEWERLRDDPVAGVEMTRLSMGMSADFEIGIEEGANIVRVGSAVFGERPA